jgi:hypothetical protein
MTENAIPWSATSGRVWRVTGDSDASKDDEAWAMKFIDRLNRGTQEAHERRDALAVAVDEIAYGFTQLGLKP